MRLLVVEDDKDLNRQITTALEEAGYVVDTAHDGNFWSQILKERGGELGTGQRIAIMVVLTIGILAIVLIGLSVSQSLSSLLAT